jgi:hypothetical protein
MTYEHTRRLVLTVAEAEAERARHHRAAWLDGRRWRIVRNNKGIEDMIRTTRDGFTVTVFLNVTKWQAKHPGRAEEISGYRYSIHHMQAPNTYFSTDFDTQDSAMLGSLQWIATARPLLAALNKRIEEDAKAAAQEVFTRKPEDWR